MKAVNIYAKYQTDSDLELKTGAKFYIDKEADSYILVKRLTGRNKELMKAQAELDKELGDRQDEEAGKKRLALYVDQLVVGWHNIAGADGKPLEYTPETAKQVLLELPDLLDLVVAFTTNANNYRVVNVAKN